LETMTDKKLYEGMFLIDSALASTNWDGIIKTITTVLEKAEAEIVSIKKWDDRKLTYDIKGVSRGTYILCYFKAPGVKVHEIEKSVQLSEQIMRVLILNAERMTAADMEKETPAALAEKMGTQPQAEEEPENVREEIPEGPELVSEEEEDVDAETGDIEEEEPEV
jgi:small subunit ribosomal protein S6